MQGKEGRGEVRAALRRDARTLNGRECVLVYTSQFRTYNRYATSGCTHDYTPTVGIRIKEKTARSDNGHAIRVY